MFVVATIASSAPSSTPPGLRERPLGAPAEVSRRSLPVNPNDRYVMPVWRNGACHRVDVHFRKTEVRFTNGTTSIEQTDVDPNEVLRALPPIDRAKAKPATPEQAAECAGGMFDNLRGDPNLPAPPPVLLPDGTWRTSP